MITDPGREEFLSEVVGEVVTPSFRADLLTRVLDEVRQSRTRRRRNQRVLFAFCILFGIGVAGLFFRGHESPIPTRASPLVVHSAPLDPAMIVVTKPGSIGVINLADSSVILVKTKSPDKLFELIGDDQLLVLLGDRPAILVQRGTSEELVFLNSADANGFQVH